MMLLLFFFCTNDFDRFPNSVNTPPSCLFSSYSVFFLYICLIHAPPFLFLLSLLMFKCARLCWVTLRQQCWLFAFWKAMKWLCDFFSFLSFLFFTLGEEMEYSNSIFLLCTNALLFNFTSASMPHAVFFFFVKAYQLGMTASWGLIWAWHSVDHYCNDFALLSLWYQIKAGPRNWSPWLRTVFVSAGK